MTSALCGAGGLIRLRASDEPVVEAVPAPIDPVPSALVVASPPPVVVSPLFWESLSFDDNVDLPCDTPSVVASSSSSSVIIGVPPVSSASADSSAMEVDLFTRDSDNALLSRALPLL